MRARRGLAAGQPKSNDLDFHRKECIPVSEVRLTVEPRTEFGKGAARRTRRAGKIPAVLYGPGSDPRHLALPAIEFARVLREHGQNTVITLDIDSNGNGEKASEMALPRAVAVHPLKNYIEHVDLLIVKRGEKVVVDVPVVLTGQSGPGTLVTQELDAIQVQAEALQPARPAGGVGRGRRGGYADHRGAGRAPGRGGARERPRAADRRGVRGSERGGHGGHGGHRGRGRGRGEARDRGAVRPDRPDT